MNAVDMSRFIAPKSDQLNADDLIGGPRTITITKVTGNEGNAEQPVNVFFEGDEGRPFRPCKSMRRVMVKIWGPDASKYVGHSMTLFRDPKVKWGGMEVGGIRISHMTGIDSTQVMALSESRQARKPYKVEPLKVEPKADKAAQLAERHIKAIRDAMTAEQLDEVLAAGANLRGKLQGDRPELFARIQEEADARREWLAPDDTDIGTSADPYDDETGEVFNSAGFISGITARIEQATTAADLDAITDDIADADLPDDEIANLDVALAKKRRALAKGGE